MTPEEKVIEEVFGNKKQGFVVDVGADHPVKYSNSYRLLERGWGGLLIEPNPSTRALITSHWAHRPDIFVDDSVIDPDPTEVDFFVSGGVSTLLPAWKDRCESLWKHVQYHSMRVCPKTLDQLFKKYNIPKEIDLLAVDCEGNDFRVMQTFDWFEYRVGMVCYEDPPDEQKVVRGTNVGIERFLEQRGFIPLYRTEGNAFYVRRSN